LRANKKQASKSRRRNKVRLNKQVLQQLLAGGSYSSAVQYFSDFCYPLVVAVAGQTSSQPAAKTVTLH
jgi:hypothetical protein